MLTLKVLNHDRVDDIMAFDRLCFPVDCWKEEDWHDLLQDDRAVYYALLDGDLIRDDVLYGRLEAADWQNDRTELGGFSYLRIGLDSAPAAGGEREQHYRWEYDRPWHYFRILPIRWRVLDMQENRALLLVDRMPDCVPFHSGEEDITWAECTLRSWLNGYGAEANKPGMDYSGSGGIRR